MITCCYLLLINICYATQCVLTTDRNHQSLLRQVQVKSYVWEKKVRSQILNDKLARERHTSFNNVCPCLVIVLLYFFVFAKSQVLIL